MNKGNLNDPLDSTIVRRPEGITDEAWANFLEARGLREHTITGNRRQRRAKLAQAKREVRIHTKKVVRSA